MRRLLPPLLSLAVLTGSLLAGPATASAQIEPCAPGFVIGDNLLCQPGATAPAPHRSLLDRLLGRNKPPAPASPVQPAPAPPPAVPVTTTPPPAPPSPQPVAPIVILPPAAVPGPTPDERTVWLHTCVDLFVADNHLLQLTGQQLDVPDLAYVLFQCGSTPSVIPALPGRPPSAASQTVITHLPVTG